MNIFAIIQDVQTRNEPIHSNFLAEALKESLSDDRDLIDQFWTMAVAGDPTWPLADQLIITAEDPFFDRKRVDLTLVDNHAMLCIGVEIKTDDDSAQQGQLSGYQTQLELKYPEHRVRMVYLTPFNRERAGAQSMGLHSITEFEAFVKAHPDAAHPVHLSWMDVADIDWAGGGDIWRQHQTYVRDVICEPQNHDLRDLDDFFGPEAVKDFVDAIAACVPIQTRGSVVSFVLDEVSDPTALVNAFRILIESPFAGRHRALSNRFDTGLRNVYYDSDFSTIHSGLFALADEYPWVWLQGIGNYGLRVAHPRSAGGVSICTSNGTDKLRIGQLR